MDIKKIKYAIVALVLFVTFLLYEYFEQSSNPQSFAIPYNDFILLACLLQL
jgi:hypothetical protein